MTDSSQGQITFKFDAGFEVGFWGQGLPPIYSRGPLIFKIGSPASHQISKLI